MRPVLHGVTQRLVLHLNMHKEKMHACAYANFSSFLDVLLTLDSDQPWGTQQCIVRLPDNNDS
jgi:hypothetical protein